MTPRNIQLRRSYLTALQSRSDPLTAVELGRLLGVHYTAAMQMLYALERDGVVDRTKGEGKRIAWRLTGKPLPYAPSSSTSGGSNEPMRIEACALAEALGMLPRGAILNARVLILGERAK